MNEPITNAAAHFQRVIEEARRHLEDTEVSKLAHFNAAHVFEQRHRYYLGIPSVVLSITLTWLLTSPLTDLGVSSTSARALPILLGLAVSILTALSAWLNFNDLALRHRMAAQNYHRLWRECKNFATDFPDVTHLREAVTTVQHYREQLNDINNNSPQIPHWAWQSVDQQRKEGSTDYTTPELASSGGETPTTDGFSDVGSGTAGAQ